MPVTITRAQRDATNHLSAIGDMWLAQRDLAASEALGEILSRLAEPTDDALEVTS